MRELFLENILSVVLTTSEKQQAEIRDIQEQVGRLLEFVRLFDSSMETLQATRRLRLTQRHKALADAGRASKRLAVHSK